MKKFKLILALLSLFSIFILNVNLISGECTFDSTKKISVEQLDEYLSISGYPQESIDHYDYEIKIDLYENKATCLSSNITYGILTEDYSIYFTKNDTGDIVIDEKNKREFETLLKDSENIKKIINYKKNYSNTDGNSLVDFSDTQASLLSLQNWYANLTCSAISQYNNYIDKRLTYNWSWNYAPFYTLEDKMAMAWSDDFDSDPNSTYYSYTMHTQYFDEDGATGIYRDFKTSGYGYDEYSAGVGTSKTFDIVGSRYVNGLYYVAYAHSGYLRTTISKYFYGQQDQASATATYFHKQFAFSGTLSFSAVPDISISYAWNYDTSPDSGVMFPYYS